MASGETGQGVGGFLLRSFLAEGARSRWFLGEQTALRRQVAVKLLRPEFADREDARADFLEAGRNSAGIVHPGAASVITVLPDPPAIVTELCRDFRAGPGGSGALPAERICRIAMDVLDVLAPLHATGRCHGNISPGNLLADADGRIRLIDFFHGTHCLKNSAERAPFLAPEIGEGKKADWRSDIFALGLLFSSLAGADSGPSGLARLLERMRSPVPGDRAVSCEDLGTEFADIGRREAALAGGEVATRPTRRYTRVPASIPVEVKALRAAPEQTAVVLSGISDIGENGVFVTSPEPLPVGSVVEITMNLSEGGEPVVVLGMVRWRSSPPLPPGMGVQFVEAHSDARARLKRCLEAWSSGGGKADPLLGVIRAIAGQSGTAINLVRLSADAGMEPTEALEILAKLERLRLLQVRGDSAHVPPEALEKMRALVAAMRRER